MRESTNIRGNFCPIHFISVFGLLIFRPGDVTHAFAVLQQFPFSAQRPGINYFALHPVSWNEATVLERRFPAGIDAGRRR